MKGSTHPDRILVAIKPPPFLIDNVRKLRADIESISGENVYGDHAPHITLFLNSFDDYADVESVVKKIAAAYNSFWVEVESLHDFPFDPVNKAHTLVYKIVPTLELSTLQRLVTTELRTIRNRDQEKSLLEKKAYNNETEKQTILEYGWPYSPESWIFHLSIGSVKDENFKEVWDAIQSRPVDIKWTVDSLAVYTRFGDGAFTFFQEYPFGGMNL